MPESAGANMERVPPQNLEAEQSVLGAMIIDAQAIPVVQEILTAAEFYRQAHMQIFDGICRLSERREPVDLITLTEELRAGGHLDEAGGVAYLTTLMNIVPTSANAEHYARIVARKAVMRQLILAGNRIMALGYADAEQQETMDSAVNEAQQAVFDIGAGRKARDVWHIGDVMRQIVDEIEEAEKNPIKAAGLNTGYRDLDRITAGMMPGEVFIIAARPGMGKSTLGMNIATHVAAAGHGVAVFSMEMSRRELGKRQLCADSEVDSRMLRQSRVSQKQWPDLAASISRLGDQSMYIIDRRGMTMTDIRSRARRLAAEHGIALIVVDFLQLIKFDRRYGVNTTEAIGQVMRDFRDLCHDVGAVGIMLSQLKRPDRAQADNRPQLTDLRASGEIEETADGVLFIHRADYYNREGTPDHLAVIDMAKMRSGRTREAMLWFDGQHNRFLNYDATTGAPILPDRRSERKG